MSSKPRSIPVPWRLSEYIFIGVLLLSCGNPDETNKQRFLIRANEALARQSYREALRLYEQALVIDSCYVPALNNQGIVHYRQRHYGQAVASYDRALQCTPGDYNATLNRSNAYYELGELYRAEDDLLFLQKNHPDSVSLYFRLGLVHAQLKDFQASIEDFGRAISMDPEMVEAWVNRGTTYYYLDRLAESESDLQKALQLSPQEGQALNTLALVYTKRGNLEQARKFMEQALATDPDDPYFLNNLGYIQLVSGDLEDARENIDQSISKDPSNPWAYRNKGRYYHLQQRYQEALRLYERALREDDFVELIHTYMGDTFFAMGNQSEACKVWKKGVEAGELEAGRRISRNACD